MKKTIVCAHLTDSELENILKQQKTIRGYKKWQIIYSIQLNPNIKIDDLAKVLSTSTTLIYRAIKSYNKNGIEWQNIKKWGGRREARCILSLNEEKAILDSIENDALSGNIIIYKHVKELIECKINKEVSDDYIWDLFKRHNWTKKVPRQSHPKANKKDQEEYKKNSKKTWQPNL